MGTIVSLGVAFLMLAAADQAEKPTGTKSSAEKTATTAPSPDEQVAAMEAQCVESAAAREKRHAEKTLYERLGGEEKIHALVSEVTRLHLENDAVKHFWAKLDTKKVADRVTKFIITGTGGPAVYEGPDLTTTHAAMKLTNADFVAAGADILQGMKNLGYGENEIDEMLCALVGLREQVVLSADAKAAAKHEHKPGDGHKH